MPLLNNRIENIATNPREAVSLEEARSFIPRMQSNIDQLQQVASYMWRFIGKGVLFKTFDVKGQVWNVPKLWRQTFWKVIFLL